MESIHLPQEAQIKTGRGSCAFKPKHKGVAKKSCGGNDRIGAVSDERGSDTATQTGLMAELVPVSSLMAAYKLLSKDQLIELLIHREVETH